MSNDKISVKTRMILDGYFYTFDYKATSYFTGKYKQDGYDTKPFIFCIQPSTKDINCIVGLNFNHLSNMKIPLWEEFNKTYKITNDDIRHAVSLENLFRISRAFELGIRYYNRKNIRNLERVYNSAVPQLISGHGNFSMMDQNVSDSRFAVSPINKGPK